MSAEFILSETLAQLNAELYRAQIDAGGASASLEIQNAAGMALVTFTLPYPCGASSAGKLLFDAISSAVAAASGIATKAVFKTSAGNAVLSTNVSSSTGTAFCRLSTTSIVSGTTVSVASGEIQF